jgi:hypothetical protein
MKAMFVLSFLLSSSVYADTLQVLAVPQPEPPHHLGTPTPCAAIHFARDGSIYGTCSFAGYSNCRYCQPPRTFYAAYWDGTGLNPTYGPACGHMSQGLTGRQVMSYEAGFSAANCAVDFSPNDETIAVDGYTFQYVSARSTDGAMLLDLNNGASYLWTP